MNSLAAKAVGPQERHKARLMSTAADNGKQTMLVTAFAVNVTPPTVGRVSVGDRARTDEEPIEEPMRAKYLSSNVPTSTSQAAIASMP